MPAHQPGELHQLFVSGVNARDLDALIALYEQDSTTADLAGRPLRGADELRPFLAGFLAGVRRLDGETRRVLVAGDIALLSSSFRAVVVSPDGEEGLLAGTSAEVARRQPDGTWRFLIDDPLFLGDVAPRAGQEGAVPHAR
jgi:uncharacterized protein (TIGR02246 family)